jgi:hypothetical protein
MRETKKIARKDLPSATTYVSRPVHADPRTELSLGRIRNLRCVALSDASGAPRREDYVLMSIMRATSLGARRPAHGNPDAVNQHARLRAGMAGEMRSTCSLLT